MSKNKKNNNIIIPKGVVKLILIVFCIWATNRLTIGAYERNLLDKYGITTTAEIYKVKKRKGLDTIYYEFRVKNRWYKSRCTGSTLDVGDTLTIVYLPGIPEISHPKDD